MKSRFRSRLCFAALGLSGFLLMSSISFGQQATDITSIVIATSRSVYPYTYGADAGCPAGAFCGFEVELFNAICGAVGIKCEWIERPWGGGNVADPTSLLGGLFVQENGKYPYDIVVNSAASSPARREKMAFSMPYYDAPHVFIGKSGTRYEFDDNGFPVNSQNIRIGVVNGFLLDELKINYSHFAEGSKNIQIIGYPKNPVDVLAAGEVDLVLAWEGIPQLVALKYGDKLAVASSKPIKIWQEDPAGGIGALARKDERSQQILDLINKGLVRVHESGVYQEISMRYFKKDIWDQNRGPRSGLDGKILDRRGVGQCAHVMSGGQ